MPEETILREKNDSIIVKRNFNAEYGFEIRINYDSSTESAEDVVEEIAHIDEKLREKFVLPSLV